MRKIVIASDSFKGCLSSLKVAEAASKGIRKVLPECTLIKLGIADGGEGTAEAMAGAMGAICSEVMVSDPLGRSITAYFYKSGKTAIIEMSAASGLPLLRTEERNPMKTTTFGTGELILAAMNQGCTRFIIGIGGSATNDGGTGMLEALGFRFIDHEGHIIKGMCGGKLAEISRIDSKEIPEGIKEAEFIIACDVDTPFCGKEGATRIFSPQKGADPDMVEKLEDGMAAFAEVIRTESGLDISSTPGTGAAGGLGGAFMAFLNARLTKGTDLIFDALDFDRKISDADLIITGEGRIDSQTRKGKAIDGVATRARKQGIPVIAIAGTVEKDDADHLIKESCFLAVLPIGKRPENESDLEYAMRPEVASNAIENTVAKAMESLFPSECLLTL